MRQVQARAYSRAARRGQRRWIIGGYGVRVQRQPVSQIGKAIAELKTAVAFSRVLVGGLVHVARHAEIRKKQPVRRERPSLASHFNGPSKSKLQVRRWLEADLFSVEKRRRSQQISLEVSEKSIPSHGAEVSPDPRQAKWRDSVDVEHSKWRCVIREKQRPAFSRAPPLALLAVRELPICKIQPHVRVEKPCLISPGLRGGRQPRIDVNVV